MPRRSESGFGLIESMVAIAVITIGALALATTFVGAAEQTRRATMRTKALEAAQQQLDRLRSIPYENVALLTSDPALTDPDWATTFCPLRDGNGVPRCSDLSQATVTDSGLDVVNADDPRQAKRSVDRNTGSVTATSGLTCTGVPANCKPVTVRRNGVVLYTYVYWNSWYMPVRTTWTPNRAEVSPQYKIVTVVARFLDPEMNVGDAVARQYATVKLSSVIADIPEIGQTR